MRWKPYKASASHVCLCVRVTYNNRTFNNLIFPSLLMIQCQKKRKECLVYTGRDSLRDFKLLNKDNTYLREVRGHHDVEREQDLGQLPDLLTFCHSSLTWPIGVACCYFSITFFFNFHILIVQYKYIDVFHSKWHVRQYIYVQCSHFSFVWLMVILALIKNW